MTIRTKRNVQKTARKQHAQRERRRRLTRQLKRQLRPAITPKNERIAAQLAAHRVFDQLWCGPNAVMPRVAAYKYLQKITGRPKDLAHFKYMDPEACRRVTEQIILDYPRLFRKAA